VSSSFTAEADRKARQVWKYCLRASNCALARGETRRLDAPVGGGGTRAGRAPGRVLPSCASGSAGGAGFAIPVARRRPEGLQVHFIGGVVIIPVKMSATVLPQAKFFYAGKREKSHLSIDS